MPTTVYFATNRAVIRPDDAAGGYPPVLLPPSNADAMTYGTAFITGADPATNSQGTVQQIAETASGVFPAQARADLSRPGRNLLVFIHGFDNTFSDALTRAAFNREWMAASGNGGADTTVIAFSWPSLGSVLSFPDITHDYQTDRQMVEHSGFHIMSFLQTLHPILDAARGNAGARAILLAHSMGNLALQYAVESWFLHGNPAATLFDTSILAAGDCPFDTFDQPGLARLSGLGLLSTATGIYFSHADEVLKLSQVINLGAQRLGQDGPRNRTDTHAFPPGRFTMRDCSAARDFAFNPLTSHQYYRLSPSVRQSIVADTLGVRAMA